MNLISQRVFAFLKQYPPFGLLSDNELNMISEVVKIIYLEKNKILFSQGDKAHDSFYVLKEGVILLKKEEETEEDQRTKKMVLNTSIDLCDEGELIGLRPLIAQDEYLMTAVVDQESIVYAIPISSFKPLLQSNMRVGYYIIESFASKTKNPYYSDYMITLYKDKQISRQQAIDDLQIVRYNRKPITCSKDSPIREVAKIMTQKRTDTIIVTKDSKPLGIITDKDLRINVATGAFGVRESVSTIMSTPVTSFKKGMSLAQAQLNMLKYDINRLCLTDDGTPNTKLIGIISEHDLLVSQASSAPSLVKAIKVCKTPKKLKKIRLKVERLLKNYIFNNIPITLISKIIHEINEAVVNRTIELAIKKMNISKPCEFAWLNLGSHGRGEQFLLTDQDNAIVFEDVASKDYEKTKTYFLTLAKSVNKSLRTIGYSYCSADMMAKNPSWCLSVSEWKVNFKHWINNWGDEVYLCSIFFDFNCGYGDKKLGYKLTDAIYKYIDENPSFFYKMGQKALEKPSPMGFFKQFLVEQNGDYKNFFDLKSRALMPLVDIGRVLILKYKIKNVNNTSERFEKMAELEPQNQEIYLSCSYAIKALLKFRTKYGLLHNNDGKYIKLEELTKEERLKLKRCFRVIHRVQELMKMRFKIS